MDFCKASRPDRMVGERGSVEEVEVVEEEEGTEVMICSGRGVMTWAGMEMGGGGACVGARVCVGMVGMEGAVVGMVAVAVEEEEAGVVVLGFLVFLAHRRPQALHRVFGPFGPFLHSGDSKVPHPVQTFSTPMNFVPE